MKTLLISLALAVTLMGIFAYVVHRNPNASQISEALDNLKPENGLAKDPAALGYLNLKKRHPDAADGKDEFEHAYVVYAGIVRLHQMQNFLESFRKLTDASRNKVSSAVLREAGNTESDIQTIGFHNIPIIVEGTILKQDYDLRQVEYKLAQLQNLTGDISSAELERKRAAYAEATRNFQAFWDTKLPTD